MFEHTFRDKDGIIHLANTDLSAHPIIVMYMCCEWLPPLTNPEIMLTPRTQRPPTCMICRWLLLRYEKHQRQYAAIA